MNLVYQYENKILVLMGSAHVSHRSVAEVKNNLKENYSDICVELDKRRFLSMYSTSKSKRGKKKADLGLGFFASTFYTVAGFVQKKIGNILKIEPGEEFKTALNIAKSRGLKFHLIDQDIKKTLRNFNLIPSKEKSKIFFSSIFPFMLKRDKLKGISLKNISMEKVTNDYNLLIRLTEFLKENFPFLSKFLIEDRNEVMSRNLLDVIEGSEGNVFAIVGAGHLPGMEKILSKNANLKRIV